MNEIKKYGETKIQMNEIKKRETKIKINKI